MARLKFAAEAMFFPRSMSFANFVGFGPKINEKPCGANFYACNSSLNRLKNRSSDPMG